MVKHYYLKTITVSLLINGSISYAQVPAGYYYNADGLKKEQLKTALYQITAQAQMLGYGSGEGKTWSGFLKTDLLTDNTVLDRYSGIERYFDGTNAVEGMNIEHSFPKSWWKGYENNAYRDLFHLYPSDGYTNTLKGNLPLGVVKQPATFDNGVSKIGLNSFGTDYTANCFEPADEYKGDFARSYFYIVTAYENFESWWTSPMLENNRWPVFNQWALSLLLEWHRNDPVSSLELERQENVYQIQGNRNPYIDYPELIEYIWGKDTLQSFSFPATTDPFIITPSHWDTMDMGIEMINNRIEKQIEIKAKNLISDLSISLKQGDTGYSVSTTKVTAEAANKGTEITLCFDANTPGYCYDTLIISSPDLKNEISIPAKGLTALDFMAMSPTDIKATTATFNWITVPNASGYLLDLYKGDTQAGNLIISKYIEGTSNNKAIEIYNGTGKSIDLSNYSVKRQSNGNGSFNAELKLTGVLQDGQTWLICHELAVEELKSKANLIIPANLGASVLSFNGNDAIALYHDGILIDLVGLKDDPSDWGIDCSLYRNDQITHPTPFFSWDEWVKKPVNTFTGIGSHTMLFVNTPDVIAHLLPVGNVTSYTFSSLTPNERYTYQVTATLPDGSYVKTINTNQCKTNALEIPEILGATEVTHNSFCANWEMVPEAIHYFIDLFSLEGTQEQSLLEDFNSMGSKGTPLPNGWSGTASGNYTSEASSGKSPNAIALKTSGEWIQSPTLPSPITQLSFMYRFPSKGLGAYFIIEGFENNTWHNIDTIYCENTNKKTLQYTFDDSFISIRFTYANKVVGTNLAIDDVEIRYGKPNKIYLFNKKLVDDNKIVVTNLQEGSVYNYQIYAGVGDYLSEGSSIMTVKTPEGLSVPNIKNTPFRYHITQESIRIWDLPTDGKIRLIDMKGRIIYQKQVTQNTF